MKKLLGRLIFVGMFLAMTVGTAQAQGAPTYTFQFDEWGNSIGGLTSYISPTDPTGGVTGPVLIYLFPQGFGPVGSGDVRIFEPTATAVVLSDVLRFTDAQGLYYNSASGDIYFDADRFIFYSDLDDAVGAPADVGIPFSLQSATNDYRDSGGVTEIGGEGFNYFVYADNTYYGLSDGTLSVPEPATMLLLGLGLVGLAGIRRKKV